MLTLLTMFSCGYQPPLDPGLNEIEPAVTLAGDLVIAGSGDSTGPALIFRYSTDNLPLPYGFGTPVDLATVPNSAWNRPVKGGIEVAPWSMTGVGVGFWWITALVDVDNDFNPFYDFTISATCGDRLGAFVADPYDPTPMTLSVGDEFDPDSIQIPSSVQGMEIVVGDPLTVERPVFTLSELTPSVDRTAESIQSILLQTSWVDHPLLTIPESEDDPCQPDFTVHLVDADGDGVLDPHSNELFAEQGRGDVWPRIYGIAYTDAEGNMTDPSVDPNATAWLTEFPLFHEAWTLAGRDPGEIFTATEITAIFSQAAVRVEEDGSQTIFYGADVPTGYWSLMAVEETGQMWRIPNQLGVELDEFDVEAHLDQAVALFIE
jgi:hypothetical protein